MQREHRRCKPQSDRARRMPRHHAALDDVGLEIEILDLGGDLRRTLRDVAERDRPEAMLSSRSASQNVFRPQPIALTGPTPVMTAGVTDTRLLQRPASAGPTSGADSPLRDRRTRPGSRAWSLGCCLFGPFETTSQHLGDQVNLLAHESFMSSRNPVHLQAVIPSQPRVGCNWHHSSVAISVMVPS